MTETYTDRQVFASTFTYSYTKLRGSRWVVEALNAGEGFPAAETVSELRSLGDRAVVYENGGTLITRARSIAAGEFLDHADADVWLSFDDDAFVPAKTLRALIDSARATRGLVGAPVINRLGNKPGYNIHGRAWLPQVVRQEGDLKLYPVHAVGFTCVAIHRSVIATLACPQSMVTQDPDHKPYPALFLERTHLGAWVGEDYAFQMLMHEAFLPRHILLEHPVVHAGVGCMVDADGSVLLDATAAKRFQGEAPPTQGGSK
jgi:hypothetical protein